MSSLRPMTQKKSETCLGREEITQIIIQELQSQHLSGQRKEANKICYYCGRGERPYFTILSEAPIRFDWRSTVLHRTELNIRIKKRLNQVKG